MDPSAAVSRCVEAGPAVLPDAMFDQVLGHPAEPGLGPVTGSVAAYDGSGHPAVDGGGGIGIGIGAGGAGGLAGGLGSAASGGVTTATVRRDTTDASPANRETPRRSHQSRDGRDGRDGREGPAVQLDAKFTFETFVTASSNRLAHAAAQAVAETPGRSYNPLFIYGPSGLGKTHLLHAIGNYVTENYVRRKVLYVTTETFMNDFVDSLRTSTTLAFKRRYRDCDVLLIDDVQFMERKEGLQEEFFHTYNDLKGASKQMVLTSDRPPKSIETLEDRLRSRFLSGLITEIDPPDLETRLAILRSKCMSEHHDVPDDVLEFIASHVKDNIRELEGALIRICAFAKLNHEPISLTQAEDVLSDLVLAGEPRRISPQSIIETVSASYGFSVEALCGPEPHAVPWSRRDRSPCTSPGS